MGETFVWADIVSLLFSLANEPIVPEVKIVDGALDLFGSHVLVPLPAGDHQVFGWGDLCCHGFASY